MMLVLFFSRVGSPRDDHQRSSRIGPMHIFNFYTFYFFLRQGMVTNGGRASSLICFVFCQAFFSPLRREMDLLEEGVR